MADLNEAFELQKINNVDNPHVLTDKSYYEMNENNDYTLKVTDDLTHNNMQPYFRKKNYGTDYKQTTNIFQQKTDLFTGSRKQEDWKPKSEVENLFKPAAYGGYIYGRPNQNELFKSRYIPSMQRNGEKPFQEIRVQPGLNLGMNEESTIGYHDPYRALPKNVDQLRTSNKPKVSYDQPVIPGLKESKGPLKSKVNKKKPEKFKSLGTYSLVPSRASFSMPSIYGKNNPINISKTNNRGSIKNNITDGLGSGVYLPTKQQIIKGIQNTPKKENYLQDTPTNVNNIRKNGMYNMEQPELTNRNLYNYSDLSNIKSSDSITKSYIYDLNGLIPNTTKRDIHKYEDMSNVGNTNNTISYVYDSNNLTPDLTKRDIYKTYDNEGNISNHTNNSKSYIYDKNNLIPYLTNRDIYKNYDNEGNISNHTNNSKSYVYDSNNLTPDLTKRDIYKNYDNKGSISNLINNSKSYIYESKNMTPDLTNRDIFKYKDLSNIQKYVNNSYVYDYKGTKPNYTKRDIYKKYDYYGCANASDHYKPTTRESTKNMNVNQNKEDVNLSYKIPLTNKKEYKQLIPNQHLKEDKLNSVRFNPPILKLNDY